MNIKSIPFTDAIVFQQALVEEDKALTAAGYEIAFVIMSLPDMAAYNKLALDRVRVVLGGGSFDNCFGLDEPAIHIMSSLEVKAGAAIVVYEKVKEFTRVTVPMCYYAPLSTRLSTWQKLKQWWAKRKAKKLADSTVFTSF